MERIESVVAVTPVWNEPLGMIQAFLDGIETARRALTARGIGFRHFFLNDGAIHLLNEYPMLVRHLGNQGLARTLVEGYEAALALKSPPDLIVRLDCQEHDPQRIVDIVDHMEQSPVDVLFLPVWYWVRGEPRPLMREITGMIADFTRSLAPIDREVVLGVYNQKFPLGYQAFRAPMLRHLLPDLQRGLAVFAERTQTRPTWGLDLLTILLAARAEPQHVDFFFGGWSESWRENRSADKIAAQRKKAEVMVDVAKALGCSIVSGDAVRASA